MSTAVQQSTETKRKKNALSDGQGALAAMLISPTMLVIGLVVGIPILMSIYQSFFLKSTLPDPKTGIISKNEHFVGLDNFTNALTGQLTSVNGAWGNVPRLINAFLNNMWFTVVCVIIETVLGVAMALIMSKAFKGRGLVRAAILVPWAIPTIVSAKMWWLIFQSSGVANKILGHTYLWLGDSVSSQVAVIIADSWKTAPFIGLLALAGLQTIPAEVYEAAKVDGATAWQQFTRITLPMVKPALVVAVLFRTLDTMRMFDLPFGMIGPHKYYVETLSMFAYDEADQGRYGPAAAYAILLFILIVIVAFLFIKLLGAELITDDEVLAMREQRKRQKAMAKNSKSMKPATITTGESAT